MKMKMNYNFSSKAFIGESAKPVCVKVGMQGVRISFNKSKVLQLKCLIFIITRLVELQEIERPWTVL